MATVADYAILRTDTVSLASTGAPGTLQDLEVPWSIPSNFVAGTNLARPMLTLDVAVTEGTRLVVKLKRPNDATGPIIMDGEFAQGFFGQHFHPFEMPTSFNVDSVLRFEPSGGPLRLRYVIMWHQVTVSD
ncbi:MAG: hypothetical protein AAFR47_10095 [Pseudomonadota bacterium]